MNEDAGFSIENHPPTRNWALASVVQRRSHHPSVFGYVLSNEVHWGSAGDPQFAELYRYRLHPLIIETTFLKHLELPS